MSMMGQVVGDIQKRFSSECEFFKKYLHIENVAVYLIAFFVSAFGLGVVFVLSTFSGFVGALLKTILVAAMTTLYALDRGISLTRPILVRTSRWKFHTENVVLYAKRLWFPVLLSTLFVVLTIYNPLKWMLWVGISFWVATFRYVYYSIERFMED